MANFDPVDLRDRTALSSVNPVLEALAHDHDISLAWFVNNNGWDAQGWYNLCWESEGQLRRIVVRLEERGRPTISISPMMNVYNSGQRCWFCFQEDTLARVREILEQAKQFAEGK